MINEAKYKKWMYSIILIPGDIKVEKENFRFYMPITTMILISIIGSFLLWLIRKIF